MTDLKDKIVVITGSSAGIGAATAVEFAKHGAKLVITGRNKVALDKMAERCLENGSPQVEIVSADIATDEGEETLVNATLKKFATIHILIPTSACYCIIKAAVTHMTRCMATELGMQGVRVNCVAPAAVPTDFYRSSGFSDEKIDQMFKAEADCYHLLEQKVISPEEVARAILFLASGSTNRITGVSLPVDCGALLSSPAYDFAGSQTIPGLEKK